MTSQADLNSKTETHWKVRFMLINVTSQQKVTLKHPNQSKSSVGFIFALEGFEFIILSNHDLCHPTPPIQVWSLELQRARGGSSCLMEAAEMGSNWSWAPSTLSWAPERTSGTLTVKPTSKDSSNCNCNVCLRLLQYNRHLATPKEIISYPLVVTFGKCVFTSPSICKLQRRME